MRAALELHKEVLQGLQTVDAFAQDMFLPEEIDLHLNKQLDSFVSELLDEGFADRQLRLDYTQGLIVKNKNISVFTSPNAYYNESGAVFSYLPGNYKHLLSTRAKVRPTINCATLTSVISNLTPSVPALDDESIDEANQIFHFLVLSPKATSAPYYPKVELISKIGTGLDVTVASVSMPVQEAEDIYLIVKNLLYQANQGSDTAEFYWEKFSNGTRQGEIKLGTFIIKDNTVNIVYRLEIYEADSGDNLVIGKTIQQTLQTDVVNNWTTEFLAALDTGEYAGTTLLDNQEIYTRQDNAFYLSKVQAPHSNISDGILTTYYGSDFVIENLLIDYIREPQPISLELEQGCELSESGSRVVANRTIEYLKLIIENPNYREVLGHNEMREQK